MATECATLFKQQQDMAQHITQLWDDLSAAREAQLPSLSTDKQQFQALQLGTPTICRKSLASFCNKRGMWQNGFIQ